MHQHTLFHPGVFADTEEFKEARRCHNAMEAFANGDPSKKSTVPPKSIECYTAVLKRIMEKHNLCKDKAEKQVAQYIREETRLRDIEAREELTGNAEQIGKAIKECVPYNSSNRD